MGFARSLKRQIDTDLVERLQASGPPKKVAAPKKKQEPRPAWTYRGARKNAARSDGQPMLKHAPEAIEEVAPAAYPNRSDRWPRAMSYHYAREISPSKEPVR